MISTTNMLIFLQGPDYIFYSELAGGIFVEDVESMELRSQVEGRAEILAEV